LSARTLNLTDRLYDYVLTTSVREAPVLARLREETAKQASAMMQISPDQGQFMALLTELIGARQCLEIGTFTGYSALAVALALPADGRIITCDINQETTAIARRYWAEAGVDHKIDLRLAPALETLGLLMAEGAAGRFDFAFIDANKEDYDRYYEAVLSLMRPGGLIAIDNVLWGGSVADPQKQDEDTRAIRTLNAKLKGDERISLSLVTIGDGLTLARKR
jgi:predicted O-methyltransferase YrrM